MAFKDDQTQKDYSAKGARDFTQEEVEKRSTSTMSTASKSESRTSKPSVQSTEQSGGKKGLFSRIRDKLTGGASNTANRMKKGYQEYRAEQQSKGGILGGGLKGVLKSVATPRKLAIISSVLGIGGFSIFGMFGTYKNDGAFKNDKPLACEPDRVSFTGTLLPTPNVRQEMVNVMYDAFVRTMGYSEDFLVGMLGVMNAECLLYHSGIERDWYIEDIDPEGNKNRRYDFFYTVAGGGDYEILDINPTVDEVLEAYWNYSDLIAPTWITMTTQIAKGEIDKSDKAVSVYTCDNGRFGAGIGLIGWTGNNGVEFIKGTGKIYQDYDWYDLPYQAAYILAGFKMDGTDSMMQNGEWRTQMQVYIRDNFEYVGQNADGENIYTFTGEIYKRDELSEEERKIVDEIPESRLPAYAAAKWYFENCVNGGPSDKQHYAKIVDRWGGIEEIQGMVEKAKITAKYSQDVATMADLLYMNTINDQAYAATNAKLCTNGTVIDDVNVAMAAASISWLAKADYENDQAAYGEYARHPNAPLLVNDWDFTDTKNNGEPGGTKESHKDGKYESGNLKGLDRYSVDKCGNTHDLIACTEFYYAAHLIAFPMETTEGYFSSCDRGTATAVRISGADDNFPAGSPDDQLAYALGAKPGATDRSGQHNAKEQKLWKPTGFMRGSDWYSFEGRTGVTEGNIMISWSAVAANGFGHNDQPWIVENDMDVANLRFLMSQNTTETHIITYTSGGTVRTFWGTDFLLQQFNIYDDADSLVRGDLTIQAPQIMQDAADFKARYAADAFDQTKTFYMSQYEHAEDYGANITGGGSFTQSLITGREDTQYNQKTGLPEFHSWEQIFIRLTHNIDDGGLPGIEYDTWHDGYLDGNEDHITQYGKDSTKANTYFTEDWEGAGKEGGEYHGDAQEAVWYDTEVSKWTTAFLNGTSNGYWRYELASDYEYRTNQIERFSMAAFMCSYASENDANIYQNNANAGYDDNPSGHILGNLYRRMSRIGEGSDHSYRYFYYNTVLSNDMLQDLVQLYTIEGNGASPWDTSSVLEGENFGPYYDLDMYMTGASTKAHIGTMQIGDRRYGLTAEDIQNMFLGWMRPDDEDPAHENGFGTDNGQAFDFGYAMGQTGSFSDTMYNYMTMPLYDLNDIIDNYGEGKFGGNEGDHSPNTQTKVYHYTYFDPLVGWRVEAQELYGINPFLMIKRIDEESAGKATRPGSNEDPDHDAAKDKWLSFIDRHYYPDEYGNINMYAYAVLAMNPSLGKMTTAGEYVSALQGLTTTLADEGKDVIGPYSDKMYSCWGKLRYTDYIYGQTEQASDDMADRLLLEDDRDGNGLRDDYNRREYIIIPYYHTHSQNCDHDERLPKVGYDLECDWSLNSEPEGHSTDDDKIDSIYWLNANCQDALATIAFDAKIDMRDKYDMEKLAQLSIFNAEAKQPDGGPKIKFFTEYGQEVDYSNKGLIPMHVTCDGYDCENDSDTDTKTCDFPDCGKTIEPNSSCHHDCDECLAKEKEHDHEECDNGDECHDHYGCNPLEYLFHTGTRLYMVVQVVDKPAETIGEWCQRNVNGPITPDKANLLQLIDYNNQGYVRYDYIDVLETLCNPDDSIGSNRLDADPQAPYVYTGYAYEPGKEEKFVGYFTIEGDIITKEFGKRGETVDEPEYVSGKDLILIESVRNRVGIGKQGLAGTSDTLSGQIVRQDRYEIVTDLQPVKYDRDYGEILVTGSQREKSPLSNTDLGATPLIQQYLGFYGDDPDTAKGNKNLEFGNSLMRYLLGDEHVFHVKLGSQDYDTVQGLNDFGRDLGYDFNYYEEFVDVDGDAVFIDCVTGELTMREYNIAAEQYKDPETGEYDEKAEIYKNTPISIYDKAGSNIPINLLSQYGGTWDTRKLSDLNTTFAEFFQDDLFHFAEDPFFKDAEEIPEDIDPTGKTVGEVLLEKYKAYEIAGQENGLNGDYGVWLTHASRGDRGMKTEYIIMKQWFGDAYDGDPGSQNMMYMTFEFVLAFDDMDVDGDGDYEEHFIYGTQVNGSVTTDGTMYGQGRNSRWRQLIDIYTDSLAAGHTS